MFADIIVGQYLPGNSVLHRTDPRVKLVLTAAFTVVVFLVANWVGYLLLGLAVLVAAWLGQVPLGYLLQSLRPLWMLLTVTFFLHLFLDPGETLAAWGPFTISDRGLRLAIYMTVRLVLLILGASLVTLTTSPLRLTDALEALFSPLRRFKFPAGELALMLGIALRFIPVFLEEAGRLSRAQESRGARLSSGSLAERTRGLMSLLVPLFIAAFRRAEDLALAMEARGYRGSAEGRTHLYELRATPLDYLALTVTALILTGIATTRLLSVP